MTEKSTRFALLGGYLGAGKTTLCLALAQRLRSSKGLESAIIMNDQAGTLVDTRFMAKAGFDVSEVLGGCFCGNMEEFVKSARSLVGSKRPQVIMAEAIGTSTNVLANVIAPLRTLYPGEFSVAPLLVAVDGHRARNLLARPDPMSGLGQRAIPLVQVREAEVIVITKSDLLDDLGRKEALEAVAREAPGVRAVLCSTRTGEGIEELTELIASQDVSSRAPLAMDTRFFDLEKADMGWYGCRVDLSAADGIDLSMLTSLLMKGIAARLDVSKVAHLKVMVDSPAAALKVSMVEGEVQVDLLRGGRYLRGEGSLILNARVRGARQALAAACSEALRGACDQCGCDMKVMEETALRPVPERPSGGL